MKKRILSLVGLFMISIPMVSMGQEINLKGWPVPDLEGLTPYSITIQYVDGVEKIVEKFYTSVGGHVARLRGDGKVFAYAVDTNREPPIDYLLIDVDGSGIFTQKLKSENYYLIPEWVFR